MKVLGLIGGMSWESTASYYRLLNQAVQARLGGLHSARLLLYSVDFAEIEVCQRSGDWDRAGALLAAAGQALARAGAERLLLCTNTMHKVAEAIESAASISLLHIADATAAAVRAAGLRRVGLLGTRFTMEQDFYTGRLRERHGLDLRVPDREAREIVHRVIYDELCQGRIRDDSRQRYREIIRALVADGAEAVILGCTEVGLLVGADDSPVPLFDTTALHVQAAVDYALG